jgi:hypothetical protein
MISSSLWGKQLMKLVRPIMTTDKLTDNDFKVFQNKSDLDGRH